MGLNLIPYPLFPIPYSKSTDLHTMSHQVRQNEHDQS